MGDNCSLLQLGSLVCFDLSERCSDVTAGGRRCNKLEIYNNCTVLIIYMNPGGHVRIKPGKLNVQGRYSVTVFSVSLV